jgi:cation:H+ antiporter
VGKVRDKNGFFRFWEVHIPLTCAWKSIVMLVPLVLIAIGVLFVSFGARILVGGASSLAKRWNVSDLVIGLTVVAFGTSAPELTVSVVAAGTGEVEVALGNVIGSNIVNICLILGVSAWITPLVVHRNTVWKEIPLSLLGILVAFSLANDVLINDMPDSVIARSDGWVLLAFFAIYVAYMLNVARNSPENIQTEEPGQYPVWLASLMVFGGLLGLTFGGQFIVENAVYVARQFGISEAVIGLTLVSIGTSIPELATSVTAAMQHKTDIAVGNVVGSNIFNTFLVLGVSASITPLPLGSIKMLDFAVCIAATLLLFISCFIFTPGTIFRKEASVLLLLYAGYLGYLLSTV